MNMHLGMLVIMVLMGSVTCLQVTKMNKKQQDKRRIVRNQKFQHQKTTTLRNFLQSKNLQQNTHQTTTIINVTHISAMTQEPCFCRHGLCSCCSRILLNLWKQKACVNITYDPDEFAFTAKIVMNNRLLYTRTVSEECGSKTYNIDKTYRCSNDSSIIIIEPCFIKSYLSSKFCIRFKTILNIVPSCKNPRPICIPIPRIPAIRACIKFYNIYFQGRNVHACINMEGKFQDITLFKVGMNCIRLGSSGVALIKPEDGGGIGQIEFLPNNPVYSVDNEDDYAEYDIDEDDDSFFNY